MKRVLLVVGFVVLSGVLAVGGPFGVGLKAGAPIALAFGDTWDDDLDSFDKASNTPQIGLSAGAFAFYDVGRILTIQVEALVGLYRWGADGTNSGQDFTLESQLFLAEFPLLAKVRLPVWRGAFTILAGPDLFVGIGKVDSSFQQGSAPATENSADLTSARWAVAVAGGIGYDLPLGPGFLSFDTRYVRLLTPLEGEYEAPVSDLKHFLHSVNFYLGYGYRLGS